MDNRNEFYIVAADVLPEALKKTAQIKALLSQNSNLTINEAADKVGLSRSAFYKYRESIFSYNKMNKERIVTLIVTAADEISVLAECLQIITEMDGQILTVNRGLPIQDTSKATLVIDTKNMKQEIETLVEKHYEIALVREIEILDLLKGRN